MESGRVGRRVEVSKRWQTKLRRPKVYLKFGCAKSIVRLVTSSLVLRRSIPAGLKFKGWYSILHKHGETDGDGADEDKGGRTDCAR